MSCSVAELQATTINRRVFSAVSVVTVAAAMVKLVAVVKEFTVAGTFGRSDALEAFLVASLVPALLINLISESMNQALIPTLIRVRELEGHKQARQLLSTSMLCTTVLLAITSAGIAFSARLLFPLLGSHFPAAKLDLAIHLFYALLPVVFLTGVASNCSAVLNTEGRFAVPALAPVVTPLAIIACVTFFGASAGVWSMVYATFAGALIHTIWMGRVLTSAGYRFSLRWYGMTAAAWEVVRQYWPMLLSGIVASGGLVVDQSTAAMLPAGSVSALVYAGRFVSVAVALLGGAVSSAITPVLSEMVANNDWSGCRKLLRVWSLWSALAAACAAGGLILGAKFLIRVTLEHGAFGPRDTSAVSAVLLMYAIQIPFFVSSRVFYRFLLAMCRTDLIFYCGLVNLVLDVVLNLMLMRWLGVAGIALATSLWTMSTLVLLAYWSWRILPPATPALANRAG